MNIYSGLDRSEFRETIGKGLRESSDARRDGAGLEKEILFFKKKIAALRFELEQFERREKTLEFMRSFGWQVHTFENASGDKIEFIGTRSEFEHIVKTMLPAK